MHLRVSSFTRIQEVKKYFFVLAISHNLVREVKNTFKEDQKNDKLTTSEAVLHIFSESSELEAISQISVTTGGPGGRFKYQLCRRRPSPQTMVIN